MSALGGAGGGRRRAGDARPGTRDVGIASVAEEAERAERVERVERVAHANQANQPEQGEQGEQAEQAESADPVGSDVGDPAWDVVIRGEAVRGDEEDFETFARARMGDLLRYATALAGDSHQGADIVQEVLVRASSRWRRIRASDRPDLYVKRMVTNEHLSWRRRWYTRTVTATGDGMLQARARVGRDPADAVVDRQDVQRRLAGLAPRQRAVLVLRYLEGMDDHEISQILDVAPSTVRSTATRALATLRSTALSEEDR
ncbi:SigE family RNA polymerase sigma factor [Cellulomonas sp. ATA003]|uniref:SigE family RNA polymerase sigma factor n=1 Tax=Cellulomonas sp. ATA003 TaxID=3073064 RepID=UPI0028738E67|nr:SigE family RNA polymerase sigma factor [Cellulomonas sp. ATA003]WNB85557.1 SigE family RNA polymerase sigma factor [Cellulomonas sp. ATA003]